MEIWGIDGSPNFGLQEDLVYYVSFSHISRVGYDGYELEFFTELSDDSKSFLQF